MREKMALRKSILAAMFLAIGLILPFITMQIPCLLYTSAIIQSLTVIEVLALALPFVSQLLKHTGEL